MEARLRIDIRYLAFGPWTAELRGDELADIRHLGKPVLRGLRAVVRNHNWLTLTPGIMASQTFESPEDLKLVIDIAWKGLGTRYAGRTTLRFDTESLTVSFHGTAVEKFPSNRIGIVVLHRPDDAGRLVTVSSPDGNTTESAFPRSISPHQPFKDIAALAWERDDTAYRLDFAGDVFETEDQRNWTDASFKTYSTPLSRPFPVNHEPGDEVRHSVRLSARPIVRVSGEVAGTVPGLGTSAGTAASSSTPRAVAVGFAPLLAELADAPDPAASTISAAEAVRIAETLNVGLDARIIAATADEALSVLRSLPLDRIQRLGVYDSGSHVTESPLWDAVSREAKELGFSGELIAGARSHFTELNRNQQSARPDADAVTYSITPQMHAVEPGSIMDTLAMQSLTAADALRISNGRPLHLGPITLAPRFNAVATTPPQPEELPAADPLQAGAFAAAWLLGSIAALTIPGVASISYATAAELDLPAGRLLQKLAALSGSDVLGTDTGTGRGIALYPVRTRGGVLAHVANLTPWRTAIRVVGPTGTEHDLELSPWHTEAILIP